MNNKQKTKLLVCAMLVMTLFISVITGLVYLTGNPLAAHADVAVQSSEIFKALCGKPRGA